MGEGRRVGGEPGRRRGAHPLTQRGEEVHRHRQGGHPLIGRWLKRESQKCGKKGATKGKRGRREHPLKWLEGES